MSRRRRKAGEWTRLAAEVGGEDGGDPREFHGKPWDAPKQAGRKSRQLCVQVARALRGALAGCGDPALQAVDVASVEPAPHTGRLRVVVAVGGERAAARAALARAAGFLRAEVATAVSRRHAPELAFEVV